MRNLLDCLMTNRLIPNNKKMALQNSHNVTARLKKLSRPRPTLATVLGSGFHHIADGTARGEKSVARRH